MARWNEEQERWMGGRYGEEERRGDWRAEHGGEGSWRGRDWRDEDRGGSWRGEERRDDWGWRGERGTSERGGPMERWSSERDREHEGGWSEREREGWGEREGRRRYGRGEYGRGRFGERGISPEAGYGLTEGPSFGAGGMYGGAGGMYAGAPGGGETYGPSIGSRGRFGGGPTRGPYGGSERWSEEDRDQGYGRGDYARDLRRDLRGYGEEEEGPFERMGEKVKEGFRKLTGRGPKGYKRSDERIREDVSERIARSWVNAEEVEVKVEKGEVTLTGFVERREDKRRLEDLADDVFGVEEVHNHLRLRRESTAQSLGSGQAQQTAGTQGTTGQQASQRGQQGTTQPGRH